MIDLSPDEFERRFRSVDEKPRRAWYRLPDGEHVQVADIRRDGTVVTDSGRVVEPGEFNRAERLS